MGRGLRIEFPGACYHVFSRGNEKKDIFRDDQDHYRFMKYLDEVKKDHKLFVFAYVLMPNHFHLVVETPESKLSDAMHDFNSRFSNYFNYKYKRTGHLFQGRYNAILVQKTNYLMELTRYVHLNPVRAGIVKKLKDYRWSSYQEYIGKDSWRNISSKEWALSAFGNSAYTALKGYKKYLSQGKGVDESIYEEGNFAGKILGTLDYAKEILERFGYTKELKAISAPSPESILRLIADDFQTAPQIILQGPASTERNISLKILRSQTPLKLKELAKMFALTHTTVSKAISKLESECKENAHLNQRLTRLINALEPAETTNK